MSVYQRRFANPDCRAKVHGEKDCSCKFSEHWYISYTANGRMVRQRIGSKKDADKEHKRRVGAVADGKVSHRKTLKEYTSEQWPLGRSGPAHAANETRDLKNHLLPALGRLQLSEITSGRVSALQISLEKELAPPTVNAILRLLKKILLHAYRNGVIAVFPAPDWPKALRERLLELELSEREQAAFLTAFDDRAAYVRRVAADREKAAPLLAKHWPKPDGEAVARGFERFKASKPLFVVALETGLDRGELLDLRWKTADGKTGVDLRTGVIVGQRKKTGELFDIPISGQCRAALRECARRSVSGHVFTTGTGEPFSVERVVRHFKLAKRLAGIKRRVRFKDLRHTLGCRLASAQVSEAIIGAVLGHSPRSTMAKRYARPSKRAQREAVLAALN